MKKLEAESAYNQFDTDHDGVVTDAELSRSERMMMIENMDKLADNQRIMSWAGVLLPFAFNVYASAPWVTVEKLNAMNGFITTYNAAMGSIVVTFMAATAYVRGKTNDS